MLLSLYYIEGEGMKKFFAYLVLPLFFASSALILANCGSDSSSSDSGDSQGGGQGQGGTGGQGGGLART